MSTVFEKLLSGEWPCAKVYEDELVFAFMDAGQVNDGHVIVATKAPRATLLVTARRRQRSGRSAVRASSSRQVRAKHCFIVAQMYAAFFV